MDHLPTIHFPGIFLCFQGCILCFLLIWDNGEIMYQNIPSALEKQLTAMTTFDIRYKSQKVQDLRLLQSGGELVVFNDTSITFHYHYSCTIIEILSSIVRTTAWCGNPPLRRQDLIISIAVRFQDKQGKTCLLCSSPLRVSSVYKICNSSLFNSKETRSRGNQCDTVSQCFNWIIKSFAFICWTPFDSIQYLHLIYIVMIHNVRFAACANPASVEL